MARAPSPPRRPELPGPPIHPIRRTLRYAVVRLVSSLIVRIYLRLEVEGSANLAGGPCLVCFSHADWTDPFILMAALPWRPRVYFFGPKEEDMRRGGRNRLMAWVGTALPYKPLKSDLLEATRRVEAVLDAGGLVAIAGEGRLHAGERVVLPLSEGAAFFALRAQVPLVPLALNGTTWLGFRRRVRVRIGEPLPTAGQRPTRETVAALTDRTWHALRALAADFPDPGPPGPFGRWLTEVFNEWPEGERPAPGAERPGLPAGQPE
ncbi:MAG TPA: lysophospholipid acyltransferase family protein [Candidatus Limnocylindrales bacterium]